MKKALLLLPMILPVIAGCAGTAKSLSSSKVFAPSCPTALYPTTKDPALTTDDLANHSSNGSNLDPKGLLPRCSQKESVYSNAVWIPVLGPLFDLSTNTNPDRRGIWYFVSTAVPIIGPTAQLSYGAKQCIAECMPLPDDSLLKNTKEDPALTKYFNRALNVSDSNCRTFLSRFSANMNGANESKDSLNSLSTITATGAAFANPLAGAIISGTKMILSDGITSYNANYLQGKVMPDLISTIQKYRQAARDGIEQNPPHSVEDVIKNINNYDALCSIDSAVQIMLDSVKNQSTGNDNSNKIDQNDLLKQNGIDVPIEADKTPPANKPAVK